MGVPDTAPSIRSAVAIRGALAADGAERPATPEECLGLERAAAWERHHVEGRLLDTFEGRPNEDEMHMRVEIPTA